MTVAAEPHAEPDLNLSATLRGLAAAASPAGAPLSWVMEALEARGFGVVAFMLGLVLLIPVKWVLPQIVGLALLITAWRMLTGARTPWLPFGLSKRVIAKARLEAAAGLVEKNLSFYEEMVKPRFHDLAHNAGETAAAIAILLAGACALAPAAHLIIALGLILLGLGLAQRDGAVMLAGVALCLGGSAYLATMLAGLAVGAGYASGWAEQQMPWLMDQLRPRPLMPR
jgi:hypothetical protein